MPAKGRRIAEGRTAEIFEWDEGLVLKLFRAAWSRDEVEYEARVGRVVHAAGFAPAVGDVVAIEDRYGIVYERVAGPSMLHAVLTKPWTVVRHARTLADLHARMHQSIAPNLPSQRQRLERRLQGARAITEEVRAAAVRRLASLSDGDRLCHGDFHPGNVILTPRGAVVIDWNDATRGNPLADVARLTLLVRLGSPPPGIHAVARGVLALLVGLFHRAYLSRYIQLTTAQRDQIEAWFLPVAVARLDENVETERARLLALIHAQVSRELAI